MKRVYIAAASLALAASAALIRRGASSSFLAKDLRRRVILPQER
jgi:hypothetical protein